MRCPLLPRVSPCVTDTPCSNAARDTVATGADVHASNRYSSPGYTGRVWRGYMMGTTEKGLRRGEGREDCIAFRTPTDEDSEGMGERVKKDRDTKTNGGNIA